jgi:hypothetical protein
MTGPMEVQKFKQASEKTAVKRGKNEFIHKGTK